MVQKPDIQYVTQFYSYGSEAKVLELKPAQKKKKFTLPKAIPQQKICVRIDPVAWAGIAVALVLIIVMAVSVNGYLDACAEYEAMTDHVISLQNFNVEKQLEYAQMYDLNDIQEKALALGMIPAEEAETVQVIVHMPVVEAEPTWWEDLVWYVDGLIE